MTPWCVAAIALAALVHMAVHRVFLNVRREEWRRASVEDIQTRRLEASCADLRSRIAQSERETERARAFLRQDLLAPRAILTLESARPKGMVMDSVTWRTGYLAEGPCLTLQVSGWAATPVERQAAEAWDGWVLRLKATEPWDAPLTLQSGPFWSRRSVGQEPSLAYHAFFQTLPTPIPPK
ncbi:MAG: hypothetical protein AAB434_02750 [Planctomycetota bacterium]